jgi:hypothetical protein
MRVNTSLCLSDITIFLLQTPQDVVRVTTAKDAAKHVTLRVEHQMISSINPMKVNLPTPKDSKTRPIFIAS